MRSRITKRLPPDADKLIELSLALSASGSRTEDRFWETRIDALIGKIVRNGNQATLDAALDHLQQQYPESYGVLADQSETASEALDLTHQDAPWQTLLIAAPVLAWTRYAIPSGQLKDEVCLTLAAHLQAHVLAEGSRVALAPFLYSIDQLPRHHVEVHRLTQQLSQAALAGQIPKMNLANLPETAPILADPRFLLAVVAAPANAALFRWQQDSEGRHIERERCLEQWKAQGGANLAALFPGCEFECLLPDAYYSACRDADERVRPHTLRTAVRYLQDVLETTPGELRAVIGGFGEQRIDEFRIGFTRRGSNDVLYGVIWPLYGRESGDADDAVPLDPQAPVADPIDAVLALLKETGVTEIRRHQGCFEPEFCEDCGVPLYLDPLGEIVHAEMPADAEPSQPHFH
jgi:hypothetical protein